MNEHMQKHIQRELINNFKAFYSSLYQHKSVGEIEEDQKKHLDDIKELMVLGDDADLKVKFICETTDQKTIHTQYQQIQDFVKNGVTLQDDVFRFSVVIRAEYRRGGIKYQSADSTPFFKSEGFVLKESDKYYAEMCENAVENGTSKAVVVSKADLQQFSNDRIRFGEEKELEE